MDGVVLGQECTNFPEEMQLLGDLAADHLDPDSAELYKKDARLLSQRA